MQAPIQIRSDKSRSPELYLKTTYRLLHKCDSVDFLDGSFTDQDFFYGRFAQKHRTRLTGSFFQHCRRSLGYDQLPQFIVQVQKFNYCRTSSIPCTITFIATFCLEKSGRSSQFRLDDRLDEKFVRVCDRDLADRTDFSHQSLGHDTVQARDEVVRVDPHMYEPANDNFVSCLNCVMAQRLVRKVCPVCKAPVTYSDEFLLEPVIKPELATSPTFFA